MSPNHTRTFVARLAVSAALLFLSSGGALAQQQVNLTAGPGTAALPDGSTVPMWGYGCGSAVAGSTASCAPLRTGAGWSPVVITVPTGQNLQINLTNNLTFAAGAGTSNVPTSMVIVGQVGGGLGTGATSTPSPVHPTQVTTWPAVGSATDPTFTPPGQPPRVQSFATEVPAGTTASLVWTGLRPGTYLIESGTHPSIQGPMGLYGMLVVTTPATTVGSFTPGTAYLTSVGTPAVTYSAEVPLLMSEIDPAQNAAVQAAVTTAGFVESSTRTLSVDTTAATGCSGGAAACYPPAVNYTPLYYLINGVAFDKTNPTASIFPATPGSAAAPVSGTVLLRLVNAGLRMHVPSVVGSMTGNPATPGFSLVAEDGNLFPGLLRVQSEVFLAAGKTYDVMVNVPAQSLAIYDRQLSLSANAIGRDGGMLAYVGVNGSGAPAATALGAAVARPDTYNAVISGQTLTVSDPAKGLIANDTNVYGVSLVGVAVPGLTLNRDGTFAYTGVPTSFTYCANGTVTGTTCSSGVTAQVTLAAATLEAAAGITCTPASFVASASTYIAVKPPGLLAGCTDGAGYALSVASVSSASVQADGSGGFTATGAAGSTLNFTFVVKNAQGTSSAQMAATVTFPAGSGLAVTVVDGVDKTTSISDYRWIIEEDRTFYVDPNCTQNPLPAGCPAINTLGTPFVFGTNFHSSAMPVVASGCTGPISCGVGQTLGGQAAVCDQGNGVCRLASGGLTPSDPSQVKLDPAKRYYISVLPGDAADPFNAGYAGAPDCSAAGRAAGSCGHGMGGAPFTGNQSAVKVLTQPSPYPPATLTVFVFEDDYPLNGEHDAGGGLDVLAPNEAGLGGFQITLFDDAGGTGDATGQPTYDMFNMPLSNSLAGTIDPATNLDACPISPQVTSNALTGTAADCSLNPNAKGCQRGIVGMIVTCPKYESDGTTLSPLAGQAVVKNLYQGRYGVVATPGADRIARGEEWLQTNTLDGQKAHDSFMRIGEPAYFQEFGPGGYHVMIGFANPQIINGRKSAMCPTGTTCTSEVKGHVTTARMSRPPDERLYGSGTRDSFGFTQCYASLGDPDGPDFAFAKCDADGNFDLTGLPAGNWKLVVFDQWNDQIVDGISMPVGLSSSSTTVNLGEIAVHQWQANIYTRTFVDSTGQGVSHKDAAGNDLEPGLPLVATNVRFRDGSFSNFNSTDLNGYAGFNEVFPLFSWYVIETDSTRYKTTGVHVVYDAGGPTDGTCTSSTAPCGSSRIGQNMANTYEVNPLPPDLSVPGAVYCPEGADCGSSSIAGGPVASQTTNHSTGRIDPPLWFGSYGWQGFAGQNNFLEFGKRPYVAGETGGIHGHVVYASTRPFDDPQLLLQLSWEPLVPHVRINLYREGVAPDGVTPTLTLVDHTETSSFDDWAQGFRADGKPNMNCPGQSTGDLFYYSLKDQPQWLNWYQAQHGGAAVTPLPYDAQFKCYDGMHNWNQLQPAPYDGMYSFPSVVGFDPTTGKPSGTNCTGCVPNPDTTDPYRSGAPMLPAGKYVVEVVVPPGYELVKEEDKNILIGDNYIAPVTQQFGGLGSIFILPDQAVVGAARNSTNPQNPTVDLGVFPRHEGDTGSVESFWPCVGAARTVPDFISLFPQSGEVAPFAGATRRLCDRKEITLADQSSALAKFYVFTPTHVAAHFTGIITDDFTAEFDPFSPQFGEKFAPANLPVSVKDWAGNEISRVYSDQFGAYNGLSYSTWEVNPPNPTGYGPTMMVVCMNDAGSGTSAPWWDPAAGTAPSLTADPLFQSGYSQFCYELPFMPGQTGYFDTPVVPTSAFSEGYNHPDCNYPDATPAIKEVDGDGVGPWVSASGPRTLTIKALGDVQVENYNYSGPNATTAPYNQKKVTRHYGFGATAGIVALVDGAGNQYPLTNVSWSDTTITGTVPTNLPACALQQQAQYGGPLAATAPARCGELVITAANGNKSVDAITVTMGGKAPTRVPSATLPTIQSAIDAASPGDLIIVAPGVYQEMVLMWKPVRLQGVGAASSIVDGNAHPAGKLEPWRTRVNCLFGLTPDGRPRPSDLSCAAGWANASGGPNFPTILVDRIPMEGILGWDTTVNGNLAEQLIEPSLMGAYEGATITVLGKGVSIPAGAPDAWGSGAEAAFPAGSVPLTSADCKTGTVVPGTGGERTNLYPGNFLCNPSAIDGLGIRNSSQGGGGILVHAWGHNLQIANDRVYNNTGTLSGGITIGQGEHTELPLGGIATLNVPPGSCESSAVTNLGLPFCYNLRVNVHHNAVTQNSSIGDELFSSTPAGAGGVTFCNGADYYNFSYNWICGNMSTGDGGGVAHVGWSQYGHIEHNRILFNQSTNPTITTNGGGLLVMGAPDPDPACGAGTDKDCVDATVTPGDGTGFGLVINANLIMGNAAESGSGGGLRLQHVNGSDVVNFPNGAQVCPTADTSCWNSVTVTNNIITNNVAGWDGGGVSLQDALNVNIVNNTIASNDTTASSGVLFGSLFAPLASAPGTNCTVNNGTQSCPQVAGLVSVTNSTVLTANLPPRTSMTCPPGHGTNGSCHDYSVPLLFNNLIWQNRTFFIGVGDFGTGVQNQQKIVTLYDSFTTTPAPSQGSTGACPPASYWDIGVRGDTGPANHGSGFQLWPVYSVLTDASDYPTSWLGGPSSNTSADPALLREYCNGSRVPPENGGLGYQVPPGTNETNALPTPVFSLIPSATVDEGNNWINVRWGPLALVSPAGTTLGNYSIGTGSSAVNAGTLAMLTVAAPASDYFGNARTAPYDIGAVELQTAPRTTASASPASLAFGNWPVTTPPTTSTALTVTVTNTGNQALSGGSFTFGGGNPQPFSRPLGTAGGTCGNALAVGASCTVNVVFTPPQPVPATPQAYSRTLTVAYTGATVTGGTVTLTGTAVNMAANPASLAFGNQPVGNASAPMTLTVSNSTGQTRALTVNVTGGGFTRPTGPSGGTCGASVANNAKCTINIVFNPASTGTFTGSVIITTDPGFTVYNAASPGIGLSGTGVPVQVGATLTPGTWTPTAARNCPGTTAAGILACAADPSQQFVLTNTGNVPLTGIGQGALSGPNTADYAYRPLLSTCGLTATTLAPGASCVVTVQFQPQTSEPVGVKTATLSVPTTGAGTPTASLQGVAD